MDPTGRQALEVIEREGKAGVGRGQLSIGSGG